MGAGGKHFLHHGAAASAPFLPRKAKNRSVSSKYGQFLVTGPPDSPIEINRSRGGRGGHRTMPVWLSGGSPALPDRTGLGSIGQRIPEVFRRHQLKVVVECVLG